MRRFGRLQLHALAYNLANFMRVLASPKEVEHWSLTTLRETLVKIGAKVVSHGRYVTFHLAEVAVAGEIDGQVKTTGGVCLNGGKSGQMAFQKRPDLQNQAIGWPRKECRSLCGGTAVRFP